MEQNKITVLATDNVPITGALIMQIHGILTTLAQRDTAGVYVGILVEYERLVQLYYSTDLKGGNMAGTVTQKEPAPTNEENPTLTEPQK